MGAQHSHQKSLRDLSLHLHDLISCYSFFFFFFSLCFNHACLLFIHQPHQAHRFLKAFGFAGPVVVSLIIHSLDMTCSLTSSMSLLKEDPTALNKSIVLLCCVLIHYYSEHLRRIIACKVYIDEFSYIVSVPDVNTCRM